MLLLARRRLQSEAANHWNAMHMSKSSLDDITMEVICGTCGTGQSKPIGYFRNHSHLTCDGCGSEITVENERFRASIAEFGRAMARLRNPYLH